MDNQISPDKVYVIVDDMFEASLLLIGKIVSFPDDMSLDDIIWSIENFCETFPHGSLTILYVGEFTEEVDGLIWHTSEIENKIKG